MAVTEQHTQTGACTDARVSLSKYICPHVEDCNKAHSPANTAAIGFL